MPTIKYDKNGNIKKLERRSHYNSTLASKMLDNLTYKDMSNRLDFVADAGMDISGFPDYPNNGKTGNYAYDANGNMTRDVVKGIAAIEYNHLNPPTKIKGEVSNTGSLANVYSATGAKLRKMVYSNTYWRAEKTNERLDYAGKAIYKGSTLKYIFTSEGRIAYNHETGNFTWQYDMKDHLGNTRAVITQLAPGQPTVMQETSYYPFGFEMPELGSGLSREEQPYLYNGKESVNDLDLGWYDYGARMYDPSLGGGIPLTLFVNGTLSVLHIIR